MDTRILTALSAIALCVWVIAGGGGGCSGVPPSGPQQVPFQCDNNGGTYHWGVADGVAFAYNDNAPQRDCEFNGLNDLPGPPPDTDEQDPVDLRFNWLYFISTSIESGASPGSYFTANTVWCTDAAVCETVEWPRLLFPVVGGNAYAIDVQQGQTTAGLTNRVWFTLDCPGAPPTGWTDLGNGYSRFSYFSWVTPQLPTWTAPISGTCKVDERDSCRQFGPGAQPETCQNILSVWRG